jgi:hypothetical protein
MRRRGFQLTELMVALALAVGPVLSAIQFTQSNLRGARFNQNQASTQLALMDAMELLLGETTSRLREVCNADTNEALLTMLKARVGCLPADLQKRYQAQVAPFLASAKSELVENLPGHNGLARLSLSIRVADRSVIQVKRLFRPAARPGAGS